MSYVQGVNLQNCLIGSRLNSFCYGNEKMQKNNLLKEVNSQAGSCETSRPDDSENVGLIGHVTFLTEVIGRQKWMSQKKLVRPRK